MEGGGKGGGNMEVGEVTSPVESPGETHTQRGGKMQRLDYISKMNIEVKKGLIWLLSFLNDS